MNDEFDYNPRRLPVKNIARAIKHELERFQKRMYRLARDYEHNDDDSEYYKYSAFVANASGAGEYAKDTLEQYPDEV